MVADKNDPLGRIATKTALMTKANRILRFRLRYAERGWPIFPLWPEAGKVLGTTYAAARAGDIKTVRFGRLLRVPTGGRSLTSTSRRHDRLLVESRANSPPACGNHHCFTNRISRYRGK